MLLELYYIVNGVDIFHYSKDDLDQDHFLLSSGFLAALTNFSQEVRSSKINFFASETEIFMFEELGEETMLVLIFENTIEQQVARLVLKNIVDLIKKSKIKDLKPHVGLEFSEEDKLREQIERLSTSLIDVDYQVIAAEEILAKTDPHHLIIYNYSKDDIHLIHGQYDEIDESELFISIRQLARNVIPLVKSFNMGSNFEFFSIESYDYDLAINKNGSLFTIVVEKDFENLHTSKNIPFHITSHAGFDVFLEQYNQAKLYSSWRIDKDYNIMYQGDQLSGIDRNIVVKSMDTIARLCKAFNLEEYTNCTIYTDKQSYIKITQYFTRGYHILSTFQ